MTAPRKLQESVIADAISNMKVGKIATELASAGWSDANVGALASYLRRGKGMVIRHPDAARETRRAKFLEAIETLAANYCPTGLPSILAARKQVEIAEDGYRRILASTAATAWKQLPPIQRLGSVIHRAASDVRHAVASISAQLADMKYWNMSNMVLRDEQGRPMDPDALVDAAVSGLGATLMMEAHQQNLFKNGRLVLPLLPEITDEESYKAGSALYLAANWHRWEAIEEQARFLGPDITTVTDSEILSEVSPGSDLAYVYFPPDWQWYNFAATWRSLDQARQSRVQNEASLKSRVRLPFTAEPVPLAPDAFVSDNEAHGYLGLCERLGLNIGSDRRVVEGLRIVEWLRGFAALSELSQARFDSDNTDIQIWEPKELLKALDSVGLKASKGATFIECATFKKGSRDLFDSPLIAMEDGRFLIFAPSVASSSPGEIVSSAFSTLQISFDGLPFEERVRDLFRKQGLTVEGFKFKRNGEEYEYDAVAVWDEYVFLFECKNRSLPGQRATPAYYFEKELRENVGQILRLRDQLITNPAELDQRFGSGTSKKTIIPVVLRNLPYARDGNLDGVHFYDFSALGRFFASKELKIHAGKPPGPMAEVAYARLWEGDTPSPEDLLRELANPTQLRINRFHTRMMRTVVGLDIETVGVTDIFVREELTPESLGKLGGMPTGEMDQLLDASVMSLTSGVQSS